MTKTVLHIDSSARRTGSVSRDLSAQIVNRLNADEIIRRDLATALPLLDEGWIKANFTAADQRSAEQKQILAQSDALVDELKAADVLVIGAPIYNFSVPAGLKAWIDLVARVGLTFTYTEAGPAGLLTGKRAIIAVAAGGTETGSEIDFATGYLRHMLNFMGITEVEIVSADTLAINENAALEKAKSQIDALAA